MENDKNENFIMIKYSILKNKKLNSSEKIVFSTIESLEKQTGFCWATNSNISELTGISPANIQRIITKLVKMDMISKSVDTNKLGGKRRALSTQKDKIDGKVSDMFKNVLNKRDKELFDYDWLNL